MEPRIDTYHQEAQPAEIVGARKIVKEGIMPVTGGHSVSVPEVRQREEVWPTNLGDNMGHGG